jgi:hypothetical protein
MVYGRLGWRAIWTIPGQQDLVDPLLEPDDGLLEGIEIVDRVDGHMDTFTRAILTAGRNTVKKQSGDETLIPRFCRQFSSKERWHDPLPPCGDRESHPPVKMPGI